MRVELEARVERLSRERNSLERCYEDVREKRDALEQILESLPYPFYVIDAQSYEVLESNAAARVGKGCVAKSCYALSHGAEEPCGSMNHPCPLDEMRITKSPVLVEHVHLSDDGAPYHAEVHAFPILDDRGELVRMIEYIIDVTARKRAEAEREARVRELEVALANVRTLRGLLPICAKCKKIRDDDGYWLQVEEYLHEHSDAEFSHSYCPECAEVALRAHREKK